MRRVLLGLFAVALMACSAILGLQEPTVDNTIEAGGDGGGEGSACGDTSTSPQNCGACGHDCGGGTCAAGVCQPVLIVQNSSLIAPYDMVVGDDGYLYFTNYSDMTGAKSAARVDKTTTNGTTPQILIDWTAKDGNPAQIAVSGGNFYFAVNSNFGDPYWHGGVVKCPVDGCPSGQGLSTGNISSYAVGTDGKNVFFGADYADNNLNDTYQLHVTDMALANNATVIDNPNGSDILYIDVDHDGGVYFGSGDGVFRCGATGCGDAAAPLLGSLQLSIGAVHYAGDRIYFTGIPFNAGQSVQWVPVAGGAATFVTTNVSNPWVVTTDATYVYYTDEGNPNNPSDERVMRCPRDGCGGNDVNAVKLSNGAAAGGNPRAMTEDATMLYWGTYTGAIWRVAK